jgi:hypothetical protein
LTDVGAYGRREERLYFDAAAILGWSVVPGEPTIAGRLGPVRARVLWELSADEQRTAQQLTVCGGRFPAGLLIAPEDSPLARRAESRAIEVGDPEVDPYYVVRADDDLEAIAVLDARTRKLAKRAVVEFGCSVLDGEIRSERLSPGARELVEAIQTAAELTRRLTIKDDLRERMARLERIAGDDPVAEVQRRALELLARDIHHPTAARALRAALRSPSPGTRILAARRLGTDGQAVLRQLASDPSLSDALSAAALDALLPGPEQQALVLGMLHPSAVAARRPEVVAAAARAAARFGQPEATEALLTTIAGFGLLPNAAIAAVDAIGALGARSPEVAGLAEEPLLALLAPETALELRIAVANALERMGSIRAVPALHAAGAGFFTPSALKSSARAAVQAIQARAPDSDRGALSLDREATRTGELGFAEDEAGPGALSKSPAGRGIS